MQPSSILKEMQIKPQGILFGIHSIVKHVEIGQNQGLVGRRARVRLTGRCWSCPRPQPLGHQPAVPGKA